MPDPSPDPTPTPNPGDIETLVQGMVDSAFVAVERKLANRPLLILALKEINTLVDQELQSILGVK